MFCTKCGHKLKEDSRFCGNCGAKIEIPNANNRNNYSIYDVFDYSNCNAKKAGDTFRSFTDSLANAMYKNRPDILANRGKQAYRTVYKYVITDKSIILEDIEYSYDQIRVISPAGNTGVIVLHINQNKFPLNSPREDKIRLFYSLIRANEHIHPNSLRQKLQYAYMMYCYLTILRNKMTNEGSIIWADNIVFDELWEGYKKEMLPANNQLNEYQKNLISNYNSICNKLNCYFANENPISNSGYNRQPETMIKIIEIMTDEDTDMNIVIARYNQKLEEEKQRYEANLHQETCYTGEARTSGGTADGFLGRTLSTAAGVAIGNKITNGRKNGKRDLLGSARCVKGKAKHHTKGVSPGHIISYGTMDCSDCPIRNDCTRW